MKDARGIIRGQVLSEKGTSQTQKQNKYLFEVDTRANKIEIRRAIEDLFKVTVTKINTSNVQGKWKRVRMIPGRTSQWKKAVVTLKTGDKIEIT